MTRRNTRTPEHRTAQRQAVLDMFREKVATLSSSQEWVAYLRFIAAFRRYSTGSARTPPTSPDTAPGSSWAVRPAREKAIKILGYPTKKITKT